MSKLSGNSPGWPWRGKDGRYIDPDLPIMSKEQQEAVNEMFKNVHSVINDSKSHPFIIMGTTDSLNQFKDFINQKDDESTDSSI